MDPRQWLDDYESRLADLKQKSDELQENLAAANGTATSPDGAVTITVGPGGGLLNLELGHRACDLGPARLTALIMTTARDAQKAASAKVVEAFAPMGDGSEAMQVVLDSMARDEEPEVVDDFDPEPEPEPQRAPVRPQPVAPPRPPAARPVQRADEDDDDNQPW
ncbi:YbaB/EbfC family nucleoid-associated protein [Actinosynnema sp. NPDC047251]|uniref:YbaB/EbfC family nucleoid-associated protein n=1 Tax=Saccharothrix espanaensis TaxID=103731 RepID=UPI0002E50D0B|nr:YbaB/EbfC family nucleoid-associated protein [Saccharothrix espanaensis]